MENLYDEAKVIGIRIKNLRLRAGLTQEQLAKNIGVSQGTVAGWERGNSKPSVRVLKKLADELNISIDVITRIDSWSEAPESLEAVKSLFVSGTKDRGECNIYECLKNELSDSSKRSKDRQKAAEAAIDGDYQVYLLNFLIQNADVLSLLQHAGYKIEVIDKTNVAIKGFMVTRLMTTSDFVEKVSRFSKASEDLINSFPTMAKEADDDAPQDNP